VKAYKLFRKRKDGSLGPLFINRRQRVPIGIPLLADCYPTKGFAVRPGWHCSHAPIAPHLSERGRVWCEVEVLRIKKLERPLAQGGLWYLAGMMKVKRELSPQEVRHIRREMT
jgi:hypothetical protein